MIGLQMWDTAGQERYRSLTQGFYRNAVGVFLVYDITKKDTFDDLNVLNQQKCAQKWLKECRTQASPHAKITLLANKNDLTSMREVTKQEASAFAQENNLLFHECSALTGDGVEIALQQLVTCIELNRIEKFTK